MPQAGTLVAPGGLPLTSFALGEQDTGTRWLDGSRIFQKTVEGPPLPGHLSLTFPHGIPDLGVLVGLHGMVGAAEWGWRRLPHTSGQWFEFIDLSVEGANIRLLMQADQGGFHWVFVTLLYTKS